MALALNSPKVEIAVGDRAPNFVLPDGAGRFVMFYERTQGRPVLLLVAPCPTRPRSCAVMGAFRARAADFDRLGVDVLLDILPVKSGWLFDAVSGIVEV